jgi:sulfatase maturation enzyme AslB (radical SAM superfamily)
MLKVEKIIERLRNVLGPNYMYAGEVLWRNLFGKTTILEINVEFVNYCDMRCRWCSLDQNQEKSIMRKETLRKLLDNILSDIKFSSIRTLNLFNGGETLLHPDVMGMLDIIKEYKHKFTEKGRLFPVVSLLTNGMSLNERLAGDLIHTEVVDLIRFSIDGGSKEKYEAIRINARWDIVTKNIKKFIELNQGRVKTGIICIIEYGKAKNVQWMTSEFQEVCGWVDHVELRYPHDWMGDVSVEGYKKTFKNFCYFLIHNLVILPNADVVICCGDLNGTKGVAGNLYENNLYEIYNSAKRKKIINNLLSGRRNQIELCRDCSGYVY